MVASEPSSAELAPRDAARQLKGFDASTALLEPRFQAHLRPLIRDRALRHKPGSVLTLLDGTPDFRVLRAAALISRVEDLHLAVGLAVCRVCELQPEVLARLVVKALGDPSPSVRNEGVRASVRLPNQVRRPMLLQAAIDEPDPFLRRAIEAALGSAPAAPPAAASC
jgi:HEAT repeat protein